VPIGWQDIPVVDFLLLPYRLQPEEFPNLFRKENPDTPGVQARLQVKDFHSGLFESVWRFPAMSSHFAETVTAYKQNAEPC
jgi:hypothetical protein